MVVVVVVVVMDTSGGTSISQMEELLLDCSQNATHNLEKYVVFAFNAWCSKPAACGSFVFLRVISRKKNYTPRSTHLLPEDVVDEGRLSGPEEPCHHSHLMRSHTPHTRHNTKQNEG